MKSILIGERYKEILEVPLKMHGFDPFWLPENPNIDSRLASHCDLSVFIHNGTAILAQYLENNTSIVKLLTSRGYIVKFSKKSQGSAYPMDINLCAAIFDNKLFHNTKYTDPELLDLGLDTVFINQGYARCTALKINDCSIITADNGVAAAARASGIDVLIIDDSGIELAGYDRGFIGGAAFKAGDIIYFTGNIDMHPNAEKIKEYILKQGFNCCSLTSKPMFDIGGAVFLDYN